MAAAELPAGMYRVMVSGLSRGKVHRHSGGIDEEDDLGWLFYNRGCKVKDVRLMVDTKSDKSRGFGFIDFEDSRSLEMALKIDPNMQEAQLLADRVKGPLRVEVARQAGAEVVQQERQLAAARDQTEALERELHLRQARLKELSREVENKRSRQARALEPRNAKEDLRNETVRQEELKQKIEAMKRAEELLSNVQRVEEERTCALEEVRASACPQQFDECHQSHTEEEDHEPRRIDDDDDDDHPLSDLPEEMQEWRVRNTFIDFYVPNSDGLVRLKTAPALVSFSAESESPAAGEEAEGDEFRPFSPPSRAPGEEMDIAPPPATAPWQLRRGASAASDKGDAPIPGGLNRNASVNSSADVSRQLLEDKMGPDTADSPVPSLRREHSGKSAFSMRTSAARREVRLKNLPFLPRRELEELVEAELGSLWRLARGDPPPELDELRLEGAQEGEVSWAQKAAGTEAVVVFTDPEDAAWLVDGRQQSSWSSATTLTLRGRVLQVEWAVSAPDWRRLRYKADTDASSFVSYGSEGTRRSCSSAVASRALAARQAAGRHAGAPSALAEARNRTVVLDGLPKSWPAHQVISEANSLLQSLWRRDGLTFDTRHDLHQGKGEGGVIVRKAQRSQDENGGTCLIRFRNHLDAKWLVEQKSLKIGGGSLLKAHWARPKQG